MRTRYAGIVILSLIILSTSYAADELNKYRWRDSADTTNLSPENTAGSREKLTNLYLAVYYKTTTTQSSKYFDLQYSKDNSEWSEIGDANVQYWNDPLRSSGGNPETTYDLWDPNNGGSGNDAQFIDAPRNYSGAATIYANYNYELHFALRFFTVGNYKLRLTMVTSAGAFSRIIDAYTVTPEININAICGDGICEYGETYTNCQLDCCDPDGTGATDSMCHYVCSGYNGASVSQQCDNIIPLACNAKLGYCTSTCSFNACTGSEASCYCSGGLCLNCAGGYYCTTSRLCLPCSTVCDGICSDSACYGIDPDCDASGGATLKCCGNNKCETGESCNHDCKQETYCSDGVDNNANGFSDSTDSFCGGKETSCSDSIDNNGNGLVDCAETADCPSETDCASGKICCSSQCKSVTCETNEACNDGNACTIDNCNNPGSCASTCTYTAINQCTNNDNCCPSTCMLETDDDCSIGCGDGVCDGTETCSNCPSDCTCSYGKTCCTGACINLCMLSDDCNDDNACTNDVCNNAGACSAQCAYSAVTSCIGGDGCCPSGCNSVTDVDCGITCGNTICEAGESCQNCPQDCRCGTGELCCRGECFKPCINTIDCDDTYSCTLDSCNQASTCSAECSHTPVTSCGAGDVCCPAGCTYALDSDCPEGCGNGICEESETCDNCPTDCGKCAVGVKCGDNKCDIGETCTACPGDCGECPVEITQKMPSSETLMIRGQSFNTSIKVNQALDSAFAVISGEQLILTDDNNDLIYTGLMTVPVYLNGTSTIIFNAWKNGTLYNESTTINVNPELLIKLSTNSLNYSKSEKILINGSVSSPLASVNNTIVEINLTRNDWIYRLYPKTDENGNFNASYLISFANPDGDWTINAGAIDDSNNTGGNSAVVKVSIPEDQYFNVRFYSPISGGKYYRGQTVAVNIEVTKGGESVSGANVTALSPSGTLLNFTEQSAGLYTAEYTIPLSEPAGTWSVSTQAIKSINNRIEGGGDYLNVKIESLIVTLNMLNPLTNTFNIGDIVTFKLKAAYPGGIELKDGIAKVLINDIETLLVSQEDGSYSNELKITGDMEGTSDAVISVSDIYGNKGLITKVFKFVKPPWYMKYLAQILIISGLLGMMVTTVSYKRIDRAIKIKMLRDNREEVERIRNMKELAEVQYFHKKIDEETYLNLMRSYESKLIDHNSKITFLKLKLKMIEEEKKEEMPVDEEEVKQGSEIKQTVNAAKEETKTEEIKDLKAEKDESEAAAELMNDISEEVSKYKKKRHKTRK